MQIAIFEALKLNFEKSYLNHIILITRIWSESRYALKSHIQIKYEFKIFGLVNLDSILLYTVSFCLQELGCWENILMFWCKKM